MSADIRTTWIYDVTYVLAPDGETQRVKRLTIEDPYPQPGYGPAIGTIHRALRESSPEEFGGMTDPGELVIIRTAEVREP